MTPEEAESLRTKRDDGLSATWERWVIGGLLGLLLAVLWAYVTNMAQVHSTHINGLEQNFNALSSTVTVNSARLSVLETEVMQLRAAMTDVRSDLKEHRIETEYGGKTKEHR